MKLVFLAVFLSLTAYADTAPPPITQVGALKTFSICDVELVYSPKINAYIKSLQDAKGCEEE